MNCHTCTHWIRELPSGNEGECERSGETKDINDKCDNWFDMLYDDWQRNKLCLKK